MGLDDLPAARALPAQLVALDAVQERADQPGERQQCGDGEPEEERGALDLPDDPSGKAEEEAA